MLALCIIVHTIQRISLFGIVVGSFCLDTFILIGSLDPSNIGFN